MNENFTDLQQHIIAILKKKQDSKHEVLSVLFNELKNIKPTENSNISFCNCGYPLSYQIDGKNEWIAEILKKEIDFRSYREFYYCPNCDRFLAEFQY